MDWWSAFAYAAWAGKRLPTEWEWEYAARGPEGWEYPYGDKYDLDKSRVELDWENGPAEVNTVYHENVSGYGVFELSGNVWEWTDSWYDRNQYFKILRGGAWCRESVSARSAFRNGDSPNVRRGDVGFRCVQDF